MVLSIGQILYVILLVINAMAVLNEERFLARIGMSGHSDQGFGGDGPSLKNNIVNLISAVRTLMRIPLIVVNLVCDGSSKIGRVENDGDGDGMVGGVDEAQELLDFHTATADAILIHTHLHAKWTQQYPIAPPFFFPSDPSSFDIYLSESTDGSPDNTKDLYKEKD
ncbi:hypothetical protein G9A89_023259 [Geosiphon pyriformis]|nr:hypothetical protein G9A89_023259 [Geosiphon pyriformis]